MKNKKLEKFLNWWQELPLYKSIWFIPFVLFLWLIAIIKNKFQGEK